MGQGRAHGLVSLLLMVSLLPLASAADSTVSTNTTWSGEVVLSGNVTVASGTTLTLAPGTTVDAKAYAIFVEGALVADQATFFSSVVPETQGSHGQGLWPGIVVEPGGQANLTETVVANASAGVLVRGAFNGTDVVFNDAYRGLSVMGGAAEVSGMEAHRMDYEAIYVASGTLHANDVLAREVAVGLANHGQSNLTDLTVQEAGVGVQSQAGSMNLSGLNVHNASVGFATVSGASTLLDTFTGSGLALAIDAGNADDFSLGNENTLSGERFLVGQAVSSMDLQGVSFTASGVDTRPVMDVRCDGTCRLTQSAFDGPHVGLSWSGPGTSVMDNVAVNAVQQAVEASGSGHADWANLTVAASERVLTVQTPSSSIANVAVHLNSDDGRGIDVLGGEHVWSNITAEKAFVSSDRTSIGLNAWYSHITVDQMTLRNLYRRPSGRQCRDGSIG
ncbi:MAG: hypothetical protein CM15mP78_02350 [Candidatus Poseidoniales archaeon]|nr:MAG: hypothetical protein CM15mP78_02350 [Candidatus Poseidoniales archaeon]